MKSISTGLRAHLDGTTTSLASVWRVTRSDGAEFYFTDHDVDILFDDGDGPQTYLSENGYLRTAIANNVGLSVDNMDMTGIFSSSGFVEDELRAGLFDYAEVRVSVVDWSNLSNGELKLRRGRVGQVESSLTGVFSSELRGMTSPLSQDIVQNYQAECRTDVGSATCMISIKPPTLQRSTPVDKFDEFKVVTKSTTGVSFDNIVLNPDFEHGVIGIDTQTIDGWTLASGKWDLTATVAGLAPDVGSQFLRGGVTSTQSQLVQDTPTTTFGLDISSVDASTVTSDFSIRRANTNASDTGRVLVTFLDELKAPIGIMYDTGTEEITPVDTWVTRSATAVAVPPLTRYIRVQLYANLVVGVQQDSTFDNMSLTLVDSTAVNSFYDIYEDKVYVCTTAGTTAPTQPVYNTAVDSFTTDGTAVFITREAFTRFATVVDVVDRQNIKINVSDARAVDGWFNGGSIIIESGLNTGIVREIKSWVAATGELELFLEPPFTMVPGVKMKLYRGCDNKIGTCRDVFNNVLNFQGEPFVPGTDVIGGRG